MPITRGECVRAWVLRQLITDCARRGSRRKCRWMWRWERHRCASMHGSRPSIHRNNRHADNGFPQSLGRQGCSRFLMHKGHTNLGTTPKHCRSCHRDPVHLEVWSQRDLWRKCRTTQYCLVLHILPLSSLLGMRIPILLRWAIANQSQY